MKKLMIYPYNTQLAAFVRHHDLLVEGYELDSVVTAMDTGLYKKTVFGSDFIIGTDFDKAVEKCDAIFFNEWNGFKYRKDKLCKKIDVAMEKGKEIILNTTLDKNAISKIDAKCKQDHIKFTDFYANGKTIRSITSKLMDIQAPVLFIGSLAENCNKFEIQLALRKALIKDGYRIGQIGTKNYCELFGFHSFPEFMFSKEYTEVEKVLLFNKYVYDIEENEHPDLILIGLPGSLVAFSNTIHNKFGIISYLISQALNPDFVIISTLFDYYEPVFFEKVSKSIRYKLGYEIDCFNISNCVMDFYENEGFQTEKFIDIDIQTVENTVMNIRKSTDSKVINIYNHDDLMFISKYIIDQLSDSENESITLTGGGGY